MHAEVPDAIDPSNNAPENHFYQVLHTAFVKALGARCVPGARLIEIGCGGSRWLPYFHRAFGFDIYGIDYTLAGLQLCEQVLVNAGIKGQIVRGNLFDPPLDWIEKFDVVTSFGLVEHFEDTTRAVSACARYLRSGGHMITLVPTMRGLYGVLYRLIRPAIYRKHIPQSRETLAQAHMDAGLSIEYCDYVLGMPGVLGASERHSVLDRFVFAASCLYWKLERSGFGIPPNRFTSPYAMCIATKSR